MRIGCESVGEKYYFCNAFGQYSMRINFLSLRQGVRISFEREKYAGKNAYVTSIWLYVKRKQ
jgi:hypothetical protein